MRRWIVFTGSAFTLALLIALVLVSWSSAADAHRRFPIRWSDSSLTASVKPGEIQQFDVTITAAYDLPQMSVFVGPKIKQYVTSTSTVGPLKKGQSAVVSLIVSVPATATPTTAEGVIFLVATSTKLVFKLPLPRPLPVQLSVVWPRATIEGVSVTYPPTLVATSFFKFHLLRLTVLAESSGSNVPNIAVRIDANPGNLTFSEYYGGGPGGNLINDALPNNYTGITVNGRTAYRVQLNDVPAIVVVVPATGYFVVVKDVGMAFQTTGEFQQVLNGLDTGG